MALPFRIQRDAITGTEQRRFTYSFSLFHSV